MKNKSLSLLLVAAIATTVGCKKGYLDTAPSNAISLEQAYASIASINSGLTATYNSTFDFAVGNGNTGHDNYGQKSCDLANDLMGQDMIVHSQGYGWYNRDYQYVEWTLPNGTGTRSDKVWSFYYNVIRQVNLLLDNTKNQAVTPDLESARGQAYGIRAWAYFNLINNFQQTYKGNETAKGVPLFIEPNATSKPRGTVQQVYDQIIADLTQAETLLNGKPRASKMNMDVSVIRGLRARVALVQEDWTAAANYANLAKQPYTLMSNAVYTSRTGFSTIGTSEWMWGTLITDAQATIYASFFSHMDPSQLSYAQLGGQKKIPKALYDLIPASDARKQVFTAPGTGTANFPDYCQKKHLVPTIGSWAADYLYMRASEMYLIEAEALARKGGAEAQAQAVLQAMVGLRNPTYNAAAFTGTALINEILLQRRIELWGEGFSLFDIKRTHSGLNRATGAGNHGAPNFNPIVYTQPDASALFLMRIPQRELDNNPMMTPADQNP
ncbi:MAG: RagB/SusD family nutrient uptake outer membrane protein [Chitinophagaceae bacterium]|nr:RagB/SusD family nutrient uptake outer membrane protein [Chitinophagaceae bacterium]